MTESVEKSTRTWPKLVFLAVVLFAVIVGYSYLGDALSLESIAQRESDLRAYQGGHPYLVYGIAFVVYVAVTGLSLPGAAALTLVFGWFFGLLPGVVLVSFASTTGATLAFLMSRYVFRDSVQGKFGSRLSSFNQALARDGAFYLFTLRLIPAVPFFVINLVMGLTVVPATTFWWVSQLGMLPGTAVYVYAGSVVPDLRTLSEQGVRGVVSFELLIAFAALGVFPILVKLVMRKIRPGAGVNRDDSPATAQLPAKGSENE